MPEVDEKKAVQSVDKAYDVLLKFLEMPAEEELSKRTILKVTVAQTLIKAHASQKMADARNAQSHVSIAAAVLDNPEDRRKYLAFTLPGIAKALPEGQKPDELKAIDKLQGEVQNLKTINDKLLVKLNDQGKEVDDLRFKLQQEREKK